MGTRRDDLQNLRAFVKGADLANDREFADVVRRVVEELALLPGELGNALRVSRPTVSRWMRGLSSPHPGMREPVRRFATRRIDEMLKREAFALLDAAE